MRVLAAALLLLFSLWGCSPPPTAPKRAVYYWKTLLDWTAKDSENLKSAEIGAVYLRLFDWDVVRGKGSNTVWGERGPLAVKDALPPGLSFVPVVYVTTAALEAWAISGIDLDNQANLVKSRIDFLATKVTQSRFEEVQIDADWSAKTRDAYFSFLRSFRKQIEAEGRTVSVTIRLHQFRDRVSQGIPPVAKGVLMLYGMETPTDPQTPYNTVLDARLADAYLGSLEPYPMSLDAAFPLYSQARHFNAYDRFVTLIRQVSPSDLVRPELEPAAGGWFVVRTRTFLHGVPLMANDRIKIDRSEGGAISHVAEVLRNKGFWSRSGEAKVLFFDYDREEWGTPENQNLRNSALR